jgi:hypothetical protein
MKLMSALSTIRHLQFIQIRYQLWYRIKARFIKLQNYTAYSAYALHPVRVTHVNELIPSQNKYQGDLLFSFLFLSHRFDKVVDWNFSANGKLWNYNLQYFDFLHDPSISDKEKISLIEDFAAKLLDGSVKAEPYPVSLRLVNWIIYYTQSGYRSDIFEKAVKLQIDYLRHNLEFHIKGNHLLENYIALFFSALAINDGDLFSKAWAGLKEQINEQVLPDGGHYESSPMYHSILLAKLILCISAVSGHNNFIKESGLMREKAAAMLAWLEAFSFANGEWGHVNDATNCVAPSLKQIRSTAVANNIQIITNKLKESGYRKMCADGFELLIDVGNITPSFQPGHAHSDMLGFCLNFQGVPVLVDTGISTYEPNSQRLLERSTAAHNTVVVNNANQSEVWSSFRVGKRAVMSIAKDESYFVEASHNGYKKNYGLIHTRSFEMKDQSIRIIDRIIGKDMEGASAVAYFHFNQGILTTVDNCSGKVAIGDSLQLSFSGNTQIEQQSYRQAIGFNSTVESICIKVTFESVLTSNIIAY